ncbi:MAG: type II secretion system protein [Chthoniobacterales bacterium]|nr:type II secretion system protein [Chthoniobacterales bacterium]
MEKSRQPSLGSRGQASKRLDPPAITGFPSLAPAFTLVELLVVMAVIAILAGLSLTTLGYVNRKGGESRAKAEVAALAAAIDSFKQDHGAYPSNKSVLFSELTGTATGSGAINKTKVYFEPTPRMLKTNGTVVTFVDPWGNDYNYNPTSPSNNVGFFDLWSTGSGGSGSANQADWIIN